MIDETEVALSAAFRTNGFTLIELSVVLTVIGVLATAICTLATHSLALAERTHCMCNLRLIGFATQMYAKDNDDILPPTWQSSTSRWMDLIKPYLDGGTKSSAYNCPSDEVKMPLSWDPDITMSYGMNTFSFKKSTYCFWYGVAERDVARPSQTILYADCTPGLYFCGGGSRFANPVKYVDYRHAGNTFCAGYCDGHVEVRKKTVKSDWDASQ